MSSECVHWFVDNTIIQSNKHQCRRSRQWRRTLWVEAESFRYKCSPARKNATNQWSSATIGCCCITTHSLDGSKQPITTHSLDGSKYGPMEKGRAWSLSWGTRPIWQALAEDFISRQNSYCTAMPGTCLLPSEGSYCNGLQISKGRWKRKSSILPRPTTNKRAPLQTHVKTRTVQQCQAHVYCHQKVVTVTACKSVRADWKRNAVVRLNKRAPLQTQNLSKQYESDFSVMPLSQSKALMSLLECFRALIDAKASDDEFGVAMQQCYDVDLEQRHLLWYIRLRQYQDHPIEKSKADKHTRFIRNHLSRCSPRQWLFARRVGIHEKKTTTAPKLSFPDFMEKLGLTNWAEILLWIVVIAKQECIKHYQYYRHEHPTSCNSSIDHIFILIPGWSSFWSAWECKTCHLSFSCMYHCNVQASHPYLQ